MRNIFVLALHDLAVAFKNKTILLILFIPCFVFVSLQLIDKTDAVAGKTKIGLVRSHSYPLPVAQSIRSAADVIDVTWLSSDDEGRRLLKEHAIDGVLVTDPNLPTGLALWVVKKESVQTLAIVEQFSALQKAAEGSPASWITDVQGLHDGGVQRQTMPTWILMLVLLIGFIILPTQVAEEKEKKLLLALLQTPIREIEWLIAKVLLGMVLVSTALLLLHLLGRFSPAHPLDYVAFIAVGSFCFSAYGVLLGLLCRTQASARALGVVFYLPHLLPSALADVSEKLTAVAPVLPSYQLYTSVQSILLEDGELKGVFGEWFYLLLVGSVAFYLSYRLMKKRWLM